MAATEHLNIPTYEQFAQLLTHIGVIAESMDIVEYEQEMSYTSEAWAVGTKNGIDVGSSDPQYHNNSKHYAEQAEAVAESIPEDYSELSDDVDQLKNDLVTDTASGTIASFSDGADNFPVRDLTVQMEPIQDLHGYENPWPAGGGVNKLDPTTMVAHSASVFGLTITILNDGIVNMAGTWTGLTSESARAIEVSNAVRSYNVKAFESTNHVTARWQSGEDVIVFMFNNMTNGNTYNLNVGIVIYEGSTAPTAYAPYSNVCPISGRTGVTVTRTGKNLYNNEVGNLTTNGVTFTKNRDGSIELSGTATENAYYNMSNNDLPAGTFFVTGCPQNGSQSTYALSILNVSTGITVQHGDIGEGISLTANGKDKYRLYIRIQKGITTDGLIFLPMIRLASVTDSTFAPYTGTTIPITLPASAGTVYGGTVDVTTGVLTVTSAKVTINSVKVGENTAASRRFKAASGAKPTSASQTADELICNICTANTANYQYSNDGNFVAVNSIGDVYLTLRGITTQTDANAVLAETPAEIVYELATTITYTLTPQEVRTLLGANNIWSDADSVSVDYVADAKLYIDKELESVNTLRLSIAPVEDGATASQAYAQGKYFFHNGDFCKAKTAIASGATFTLNTNYEVTTVAAELFSALN